MSMDLKKYSKYWSFLNKYKKAQNAATGSEVDSNANVENKNVATLNGELYKKEGIGFNRYMMTQKLRELFDEETANEYIRQIESHEIYKHDETSPVYPYTYYGKEAVVVTYKKKQYLVSLEKLYEICNEREYLVDKEKWVWCKFPKDMSIMDKKGFTTKVTRLVKKKRHRDMVMVQTSQGRSVIVTDNHPMIVENDVDHTVEASKCMECKQYLSSSSAWTGKDLNVPFVCHKTYGNSYSIYTSPNHMSICNYNKTEACLTDEFGYFVGCFLGNGYIDDSNLIDGVRIIIRNKKVDVLYDCAENLFWSTGVYCDVNDTPDGDGFYELIARSEPLAILFREDFGLDFKSIDGKSEKKVIGALPKNIVMYNKGFVWGLISGLVDSTGYVETKNRAVIFSRNRTLISQLSHVFNMLVHPFRMIYGYNNKDNCPVYFIEFLLDCDMTMFDYKENCSTVMEWVGNIWDNVSSVNEMQSLEDSDYIYDITTESSTFVMNGMWVHNCVSITMYPFLFHGLRTIGGISDSPKNLQSFCGSFVNLVFAIASQFAGAVSTPEFLPYLDYFIRKEYGDDYYLNSDMVVECGKTKNRTLEQLIEGYFQQVIYSINQPAAARNFQSVFWNIAYFDEPYFRGMFENFVFPDGSSMQWESVSWLQKKFMNWFNEERRKKILTFPVETMNLLDDGEKYVDEKWADFTAEMYSKGHSFFTYRSNSVDSLASCCYSKDTKVLILNKSKIYCISFEELYKKQEEIDEYVIYSNGEWNSGTLVKLPKRKMYKVTTKNGKVMYLTDNHRNNCYKGVKLTSELTKDDFIAICSVSPEALPYSFRYMEEYRVGRSIGKESMSYIKEVTENFTVIPQSMDMRFGLMESLYAKYSKTDSKEIIDYLDALSTSLGRISYIEKEDGLYKISIYDKVREWDGEFISKNGIWYVRIASIEEVDYDGDVYCFEMMNRSNDKFTLANGIHNYNCRLRNEVTENTFSYTLGAGGVSTGSKCVITINMNRLVQNVFKKNPNATYDDISEAVREQTKKVHKYLLAYNDYMKDLYEAKLLTVYHAGYISLEKQYLTIGINGFVESAEYLGLDISPNEEYFKYGEAILKSIYEENKKARTPEVMFNTEYVPAENLGVKNALWDKADGYFSPRDCYNSYFFRPEDDNINVIDKFILHGDSLTKYLDGGQLKRCWATSYKTL